MEARAADTTFRKAGFAKTCHRRLPPPCTPAAGAKGNDSFSPGGFKSRPIWAAPEAGRCGGAHPGDVAVAGVLRLRRTVRVGGARVAGVGCVARQR